MKTRRQLRNVTTATGKPSGGEHHDRLAATMRGLLRGAAAPALALAGLAMTAVAVPTYASGPAAAALTRAAGPAACRDRVPAGSAGAFGRAGRMPWMYAERAVPLASSLCPGRMPWMYAERAVPLASSRRPGRMPWMYAERPAPLASSRRPGQMPWMYAERAAPLAVSRHRDCRPTAPRS